MVLQGNTTVTELKAKTVIHLKDRSCKLEDFCFKFVDKNNIIELLEEDQLIHTISQVKKCRQIRSPLEIHLVTKTNTLSKNEQIMNKKIGNLIGFGLYRFDYIPDVEIAVFRKHMSEIRSNILAARNDREYLYLARYDSLNNVPSFFGKLIKSKIHLRLHIPSSDIVRSHLCAVDETPFEVLSSFIPRNKQNFVNQSPENYVFKATDSYEYLFGNYSMLDFYIVREGLRKHGKVDLSIQAISCLELNNEWVQASCDSKIIESPEDYCPANDDIRSLDGNKTNISSVYDIPFPLDVELISVNLDQCDYASVSISWQIFTNSQELCPCQNIPASDISGLEAQLKTIVSTGLALCNLPRSTRFIFTLYGRRKDEDNLKILGKAGFYLFDYKGYLRNGRHVLNIQPNFCHLNKIFVGATEKLGFSLNFNILHSSRLVIFPRFQPLSGFCVQSDVLEDSVISQISGDNPSEVDMNILWAHRWSLSPFPELLPRLLHATDWSDHMQVIEIYLLIHSWPQLNVENALELLGHQFDDPYVRAFAVRCLEQSQLDLQTILFSLVQALKFEPYIGNPLFIFLLKRCLLDRHLGQRFFWHLKAEMNEESALSFRFALYLEAFVRGVGEPIFDILCQQNDLFTQLLQSSRSLKKMKGSTEKQQILDNDLENLKIKEGLSFPIISNIKIKEIVARKCRYMDSKKLPLWLVFETLESLNSNYITLIFKDGDDLRQDMLTLQMLRLMDSLWIKNGLDMCMTCYDCISTGESQGLIEVVSKADTVSNIQVKSGGSIAAFRDQPLADWLRTNNCDGRGHSSNYSADEAFTRAIDIFTKSCAGYCVATYILGIGDRHNDNIMLSEFGNLFHIDFGHFLGNIKRKFGFKRERAPFVLTPDFIYVINQAKESGFPEFVELCIQAYIIIRRNARLIINLFSIMLAAGIPELRCEADLMYLSESLCLGKSDAEAEAHFRLQIDESVRLGWSTQLNWWIHNIAHNK